MSHTVLICDDAIFMRTMVGDILQQAGFEVVGEAETGIQAVEKYKQLKPDLVTMDIVMPDMGGIDAVREITKFDPNAKVLMCSAMGQQALVVEAIQAGANPRLIAQKLRSLCPPGSVPEAELAETWAKFRPMLEALGISS